MRSIAREIRYAIRALLAQPAWTTAAVLCIALGAGANTAAFSLLNGLLLRPLPFEEPGRLVMMAARDPARLGAGPVSLAEFRLLSTGTSLFEHIAARTYLPVSLADERPGRMVQTEFVTGGYFDALRVRALTGHTLGTGNDRPGIEPEAVISERLWRGHFHADRGVIGRSVRVNGRAVTLRGVMPTGFTGAMQLVVADVWLPASTFGQFASPANPGDAENAPQFGMVGRLRAGVSISSAKHQLDSLLTALPLRAGASRALTAEVEAATGFGVPPGLRGAVKTGTGILFGLMALLIAVSVANVAGLMLARAAGRHRETAVRLAMGAGRLRITGPLLIEGLIVAMAGTCLGALLTYWLPQMFASMGPRLPEHLSFAVDLSPDWRVAIYAALSAVGIAALFSLAPARQALRTDLVSALKGAGGNSRLPSTLRTLNIFVIGQISISTVLLMLSVLLARTYLNTTAVDPGIELRNGLAVSVNMSHLGRGETNGKTSFEKLLARVAAIPGVRLAALTRQSPLGAGEISSVKTWTSAGMRQASVNLVSSGYFETLGIQILRGRSFGPADRDGVIVNETMALELWPGTSPIGNTIRAGSERGKELEVIGVARDIKNSSLSERPQAVFYQPFPQSYSPAMTLVVRTATDPQTLKEAVRKSIQDEDRDLAIAEVRTLEEQFRDASAPAFQRSVALGAICGAGLLMSALGLSGVVSYAIRQRMRELGVRVALGAQPGKIAGLVLWQSARLVLIGLFIGLGSAIAAARLVSNFLYGVAQYDPLTMALVAATLTVVTLLASFGPVRWATKVNPMEAMRVD